MAVWLSAEITESSVSTTNNTSVVTVKLYANWSYGSWNHYSPEGGISIDGTVYSFNSGFNPNNTTDGSSLLATASKTVTHNNDGSKTVQCTASYNTQVSSGIISWSGSKTLTKIPRASEINLAVSTIDMGKGFGITIVTHSSSFKHDLTYSFGSASGTIQSKVASGVWTWTVPLSLANQVPNALSGVCTITCKTYDDSTLIGTKTATLALTVPSSVVPSVSSVTVDETVSGLSAKFGAYVQGKSKINVKTVAAGSYSSTIKTVRVNVDGADYTGTDVTTPEITGTGTLPVTVVVTDSRGRQATTTKNITVLAYTAPTITKFSAERCDESGNQDYEGSRILSTFAFDIATVNDLNDKYYEIVYRKSGETSWAAVVSGNSYSMDTTNISSAVFDPDYSYEVALNVYDYFGSTSITVIIPTAFTLVDYRSTGKGIAFGKVSEKDAFEVAIPMDIQAGFVDYEDETPTLQNSWTNYGVAYKSASYHKDAAGYVHLSGLIKGGATTAETVIFNLPTGYRPSVSEKFFCVSMNAICVIDVYTSGDVAIKTGANAGWLSLSGIIFKAG